MNFIYLFNFFIIYLFIVFFYLKASSRISESSSLSCLKQLNFLNQSNLPTLILYSCQRGTGNGQMSFLLSWDVVLTHVTRLCGRGSFTSHLAIHRTVSSSGGNGLVLLKLIPDCEITLALITPRAVNQTGVQEQNPEERIAQSLRTECQKRNRNKKSFPRKCPSDETRRKRSERVTCILVWNLGMRVKTDVETNAY